MKALGYVAACLVALVAAGGCAKTTVTDREFYTGERLPRPARIIVYDFVGNPADVPTGVTARYLPPTSPPTADETDTARKLGAEVAKELVQQIQAMGLPAVRAVGQPSARPGDLVLVGYFLSVDQGSVAKRIALGFGAGSASLRTEVEGYLMTTEGLRRLGSMRQGGRGRASRFRSSSPPRPTTPSALRSAARRK